MRQDELGWGWVAWKRGMDSGKNAICQNAIGHRLEILFSGLWEVFNTTSEGF